MCCLTIQDHYFLAYKNIDKFWELVDSLCRDGADAQYMQYYEQKLYNFSTDTLNAYLST